VYFDFYNLLQFQNVVGNGHFAMSTERPNYDRALKIKSLNKKPNKKVEWQNVKVQ